MTPVTENRVQRRRGWRSQLTLQSDAEYDVLSDRVIDESEHNSRFWNWRDRIYSVFSLFVAAMHRSVKTALIAVAILACLVVVIILLNLGSITSSHENACVKIDGEETCYASNANPYRFYGTKTAYHIVNGKNSLKDLNVGECVPQVFYLLCRHATRYPDKENIEEMIELLPLLQEQIHNNSLSEKVKMCPEDLKALQNWTETMRPENDNKMSATGVKETIQLAWRFKAHFPTLLGGSYTPEKFTFEFTSRERTRSTAEAFAQGLFGNISNTINFDNGTNDKVLQFHKDCKNLQEKCKDPSYDISEIEKFEKGPLMQKVIDSVSSRIGVTLTYEQVKIIHKACVFGYALDIGDAWCSVFTSDELKVLEFGDDIDDYYKDAYGNKVNYEQACPVVNHIMELFRSYSNSSKDKVLMQFSHAGGVKKVMSIFKLFEDEKPMTADNFCSQQERKWRSSIIAPFTTNLALVLYKCGDEKKIAAFHNEKPIKLGGCSDILCPYKEFYKMYNPIAKECDIDKICCTCCNY